LECQQHGGFYTTGPDSDSDTLRIPDFGQATERPFVLLRIAVVWNIPVACNRASADFMISSPLMTGEYERFVPDYQGYRDRMKKESPE